MSNQNLLVSDPCSNFTLFQKLDQRQSTFRYAAPGIDDSKLTPGWYGIPTKWKLLESAPKTRSCGTRYPLWKSGTLALSMYSLTWNPSLRGEHRPLLVYSQSPHNDKDFDKQTCAQNTSIMQLQNLFLNRKSYLFTLIAEET